MHGKAEASPTIFVLAGTNGAGKSSVLGAQFVRAGTEYFNPDEYAKNLREKDPQLSIGEANGLAWNVGRLLLEAAIETSRDFAFETTLGGNTIPALLERAALAGMAVRVLFVGLNSPEVHIARVAARVRKGGHDIEESTIRQRFDRSRLNLVWLLPNLAELRVFDNSFEADPSSDQPLPKLVLHFENQRVLHPKDPGTTPGWARLIVDAAFGLSRT